jgi:hypothetical protein
VSAIEITSQDLSISQLRAEAARTADAKQAQRLLAIAVVLDGHSRLLAAQAGAVDRQTPRDWAKSAKGSSWRSQLEWLAEGIRYARGPAPAWASASSGRSPAERTGEVGGRRPRPQDRWRGALALC